MVGATNSGEIFENNGNDELFNKGFNIERFLKA
jgi:hypothetical protein